MTEFIDRDGAQAYLFSSDHDLVVVARAVLNRISGRISERMRMLGLSQLNLVVFTGDSMAKSTICGP